MGVGWAPLLHPGSASTITARETRAHRGRRVPARPRASHAKGSAEASSVASQKSAPGGSGGMFLGAGTRKAPRVVATFNLVYNSKWYRLIAGALRSKSGR